jgi:polysaccharide export outer membrane protein
VFQPTSDEPAAKLPAHETIRLCQWSDFAAPAAGCQSCDDGNAPTACGSCAPPGWNIFQHGEYVGPARTTHVPEYRLRVDDVIDFVYRLTREQTATPYRLNVGDVILVESLTDASMNRGDIHSGQGLVIQPDGTVTLHILGQVPAARLTLEQLRRTLIERYSKFYHDPQIIVTPLKVNTQLEDIRASVDARYGDGGQGRRSQVTPEGSVQLPAIGSVPAQGLTLDELKREVDARYAELVDGLEVTPILKQRAPRYVYVLGEVRRPGRFVLEGPTTVMQAIALAEGWNPGGNTHEVVVFRRRDDWQLMATKLSLCTALLGKNPSPADEIWLRDADLVIVPKRSIKVANELIEMIFTRGLYGVLPTNYSVYLGSPSLL